ncbi:hypothetical protein P3T43_006844 [Paraburkholderia sp. GAS41]|jgi:hypothetical protein
MVAAGCADGFAGKEAMHARCLVSGQDVSKFESQGSIELIYFNCS